jgi:hydrogenase large subunit
MVKQTNPSLLQRAEKAEARHADLHGYRTVADIMRAFNPFEGEMYKQALDMSRVTREMFCLMEGRHVHPSTLYPGGVGTVPTPQVFTDYLVRLMHCMDFVKRAVPLNDDLFDFFYEALPGYEEVGRRRILLGCWGAFQDPDAVDYTYRNMPEWGRRQFVTPGIIVDGELITTSLLDINLGMRILLGNSYYEDWVGEETFVTHDPLGNPIDQRHPWNQTTLPLPQKRNLEKGPYSWVMSPRWY